MAEYERAEGPFLAAWDIEKINRSFDQGHPAWDVYGTIENEPVAHFRYRPDPDQAGQMVEVSYFADLYRAELEADLPIGERFNTAIAAAQVRGETGHANVLRDTYTKLIQMDDTERTLRK